MRDDHQILTHVTRGLRTSGLLGEGSLKTCVIQSGAVVRDLDQELAAELEEAAGDGTSQRIHEFGAENPFTPKL